MGVFWDYVTTYLHQNGQNTVHTSPTKLRGHFQTILEKITDALGGEAGGGGGEIVLDVL